MAKKRTRSRKETPKPNFIVKFDGKEYTQEEQSFLIGRFIQVLARLDNKRKGEKSLC